MKVQESATATSSASAGTPAAAAAPARRRRGFLRWLDLSRWVHHETAIQHLPMLLFITLLGLIYIGNAHLAETYLRRLHGVEKRLNESAWEYTVRKAEWDNLMRQSQIARLVQPLGLVESRQPPQILSADE
ncbi:MAG: FtsL-like putative cell division protein [Chitinophagales bacterium]|nr:FtsL-like putative cell division protein [Chitinophagales bacterium]MDW8392949.1 FtsL-like putative cell division protein [Chitinophagales bacterium]